MPRALVDLAAASLVRSPLRIASLVVCLMLLIAGVTVAQDDEDEPGTLALPGSGREVPLYVVEGDIFILEDGDWCENLIALTEDDADGARPADAARTERCEAFLGRLAENDVVLLPRSLAAQLVALPDDLLAPDPTPAPSMTGGTDAVRSSGRGEARSEPFLLSGGDYAAVIELDPDCEFFAAFLTEVESGVFVTDIEATGSITGIRAGEYYWDVLAPACDWSIDLTSD